MARKRSEGRGLSSAVLLGLRKARHDVMLVMDADLQHEPESVPAVAAPLLLRKADFSVGSRNVAGGKVAGWTASRKLISQVATLLAWPVTTCRDPMSGFFCLDKETLKRATYVARKCSRCCSNSKCCRSRLLLPFACLAIRSLRRYINDVGFKIGLELQVRCKCRKIAEVPITFQDREEGESKLTMKQNIEYVDCQHIAFILQGSQFLRTWTSFVLAFAFDRNISCAPAS